ncbi:MAG: TonB-dependent receptor [Acidobacteria bacterium]|nr:TonB-dependent receptor [Acidobacteriota bacterium]
MSDASGRPMDRVPVQLVTSSGAVAATALSDATGRVRVSSACRDCSWSAAQPGFKPSTAPASATPAVLTLTVAPVRESVIVTATRDAAPTSQVGASHTVFDRDTITRRGEALVGDLLREAPGATVVQNGGRGAVTSLFVRGGENSYTKVLLDGIPLNEPGGTFNFGGLTTGDLERVELVRGAQSALFGSDAMAGVLQLVTERGRTGAPTRVRAEVSTGSYATRRGSASVSGALSGWDYALHGSRFESDNRAPNSRFTTNTASLAAGRRFSPSLELRLVGRIEDGRAGTPGQTAFGRPDMDAFFTQQHQVGGVTLTHDASSWLSHRATYALAVSDQVNTNLVLDAPYVPAYQGRVAPFEFWDFAYDTTSRFRRHYASDQADARLSHGGTLAGAEILTVAADWNGERATLTDRLAATTATPSRNNIGLAVQHQHVSARLALTTGVRLEDNASFGTAITPRVSASLWLRTSTGALGSTKVKVNAGTGIKEPTMRQSFSVSPFDLGNPDLEAERSRTVDAGVEQRLWNDRAKVDVVLFRNIYRNQVSTRTISFSPYQAQYVNVGRTDATGLEAALTLAPAAGIHVSLHHTWLDSEIIDNASEFSPALGRGQWALRRPRHSGGAAITFDRGRLTTDLGVNWQGRRNDSDFSSLSPAITFAEGYTLVRAHLAFAVTPKASVFVRGDNLTNVNYMEPLGYLALRRTVHAGVRLTF